MKIPLYDGTEFELEPIMLVFKTPDVVDMAIERYLNDLSHLDDDHKEDIRLFIKKKLEARIEYGEYLPIQFDFDVDNFVK